MLRQYGDLLANVRRNGIYHPIRSLVQPDDPTVKEVADVLIQTRGFIDAAQDFVFSFTPYQEEVGDYWGYPMETLAFRGGDCDDLSILLCSILRNYIPPDQVFCAIGDRNDGEGDKGHMWVVTNTNRSRPRIVEATAPSSQALRGKYTVGALFNDKYAFATERGLKEFGLIPAPGWEKAVKA